MKANPVASALILSLLSAASVGAAAIDVSSNYGTWTNGSNGGSGFLPWAFSDNNNNSTQFAGYFLGTSTAGAGDIDSGGSSFGVYANPGAAFANADRSFATSLATGDVFSFQLAVNFDNGNKGFNLYAGAQGEVFNFNLGGGAGVSSANAALNPISGTYDYGGADAVIDVQFSVTSVSSFDYSISRSSGTGTQGTLFSGSVTGLTESVSGFRFYNSGTDNGSAQNNLYFNSLEVVSVPEPSSLMLLAFAAFPLLARRR
jgi:hypothetical protein